MTGQQQDYLRYLGRSPRPIREVVRQMPALKESYNAAVIALRKHRDSHIQIACLYIITMSKSTRTSRKGCPVVAAMDRAREEEAARRGPIRGTGGTELATLLKAGRDATKRAVLE